MSANRDAWFEKGRLFKKSKDFQSAILCFQAMLKENALDPLALNELFKCYLVEGRAKEGVDTVNRLMKLYVDDGKKVEALTVYGELMQLRPQHCFDQAIQVQLADWLGDVKDHFNEIQALRNYAHRYPHDKRGADLLLRASRLAQSRLKDPTLVRELADWICNQYPDTEAAEEAAELFFSEKV